MAEKKMLPPVMTHNTFPFLKLQPEIRFAIWEHTWPEARVAEVALHINTAVPEQTLTHYMRITGRLSTFLRQEFRDRILEDPPLEVCPDHVALRVCRESRAHALEKYVLMGHPKLVCGSFYFYPGRDLFWLSADYYDAGETIAELRGHYSKAWDSIELVVAGELEWQQASPEDYCEQILEQVPGLRIMTVIMDSEGFGEFSAINCEGMNYKKFAETQMGRDRKELGDVPWEIRYMNRESNVLYGFTKDNPGEDSQ